MSVRVIEGDCRFILATLPDESVHSVVTDPPYGLGFMGKAWDHAVPGVEFWAAMLRVAKPGAHLLAFGGTRTFHRMACAIEDAGWELRDTLMWVYGSGFPKSKNLHDDWEGWGTALKPAWEPIIMARKPFSGSVADNVIRHNTAALNIDGCRVEGAPPSVPQPVYGVKSDGVTNFGAGIGRNGEMSKASGRWPANVIHDGSDEVLSAFPDAPGAMAAVTGDEPTANGFSGAVKFGGMRARVGNSTPREDVGSAARFFYCAKASREDRNVGMQGEPEKALNWSSGAQNHHPTVKPTELMRWLVRLVTPPGGTVLDPFLGSGSTARACDIEGFDCIGIEIDPAYAAIARKRISGDAPLFAEAGA